jgi:hypothetical protein
MTSREPDDQTEEVLTTPATPGAEALPSEADEGESPKQSDWALFPARHGQASSGPKTLSFEVFVTDPWVSDTSSSH